VAYNPFMVTLSSPAVGDGRVYIGSNDSVFTAHDADTGAIVWSREIQSYNSSPAVVNGVVYAGGGLGLYMLDAATGTTLKTFDVGFAYYSSPVVVNGMVYVGSFDNKVYAFGLPD
jgi:outer membrane protein assembly factor BamB